MPETETPIEPEIIEQPCDSPVQSVAVASKGLPPTGVSPVRMENLIGRTLLIGVLTSTIIVSLGGVVYVCRHAGAPVHYRVFRGEPSDLRTLAGIWAEVKTFSGRGIIQLGLILLVCLQVVRVALTGVLYLKIRDRMYVAISAVILALLFYGLFIESIIRR